MIKYVSYIQNRIDRVNFCKPLRLTGYYFCTWTLYEKCLFVRLLPLSLPDKRSVCWSRMLKLLWTPEEFSRSYFSGRWDRRMAVYRRPCSCPLSYVFDSSDVKLLSVEDDITKRYGKRYRGWRWEKPLLWQPEDQAAIRFGYNHTVYYKLWKISR